MSDKVLPLPMRDNRGEAMDRYPSGEHDDPCIICGRPVDRRKNPWMLHVVDGGASVHVPDAPGPKPTSDLGWHPIGSDCLRRHPELRAAARRMKPV